MVSNGTTAYLLRMGWHYLVIESVRALDLDGAIDLQTEVTELKSVASQALRTGMPMRAAMGTFGRASAELRFHVDLCQRGKIRVQTPMTADVQRTLMYGQRLRQLADSHSKKAAKKVVKKAAAVMRAELREIRVSALDHVNDLPDIVSHLISTRDAACATKGARSAMATRRRSSGKQPAKEFVDLAPRRRLRGKQPAKQCVDLALPATAPKQSACEYNLFVALRRAVVQHVQQDDAAARKLPSKDALDVVLLHITATRPSTVSRACAALRGAAGLGLASAEAVEAVASDTALLEQLLGVVLNTLSDRLVPDTENLLRGRAGGCGQCIFP